MANPPQPTNPNLTLDGENIMAIFMKTPVIVPSTRANSNETILSYSEFVTFLNTYIPVPPLDASKLPITPDPVIVVPDGQKEVFPPTPPTRLTFLNKVVLVVGGSKDIGRAISNFLAQQGYNVIATSRNPTAYIESENPQLSHIPLDVRSQASVNNFFDNVIKPIGRLDVLIVCAGIHWSAAIPGVPPDDLKSYQEIKPLGHHRCVTAAIPYMRLNPDGRVLLFSSVTGSDNIFGPFIGGYDISNHALSMLTYQYNMDERILYALGHFNNPITYITMVPGVVLSTIGCYDISKSTANSGNPQSIVDAQHILLASLQAGLGAPASPACLQSVVAGQVFDIISAPQPTIKYFAGDPANPVLGFDIRALTIQSNSQSDTEYANFILPIYGTGVYTDAVVNGLRAATLAVYSG